MEELLKEVTLSERRKQHIDSFIQTVTKLLQTVPESPVVEVCCIYNITFTIGPRGSTLILKLTQILGVTHVSLCLGS